MMQSLKSFVKKPTGIVTTVILYTTLVIGFTQVFDWTCRGVKSASAIVAPLPGKFCVTSDKVRALADTVSRNNDDTMRYDLGENISDLCVEQHKTNLTLAETVDEKTFAKLRPIMTKDSLMMIRMHQRMKYRR